MHSLFKRYTFSKYNERDKTVFTFGQIIQLLKTVIKSKQ